jgi:tripartite-type tricarboxylate transporter receptor subunit TctC
MNRAFFGSALATLLFAGQAPAQPYPSRPVTFIVPYGAGGPVDTLARILSEPMRTSLGQPVIVENVTGASGTIGVARAVRAAPDGYTVSIGNWPSHVVNGAIYTLPYDIRTDFEPVARLPSNPYVVVARKDLPATDLKGLVAWLKANPDKATEGTAGPGSGQHVSGIYFQDVTKTRFQFVPYRAGSAEIMRDLVAGHIDLTFDQAITALPHVRNGGVKAYAVTSNRRSAAAPDIPTVDEAGAPGRVYFDLVWTVGAERHSARSNPQALDRRNGRACRPNGTPAADRPRSRNSATGAANRRSAGRASEGRDREMVAADQSGQHQG